jgi:hypothetical protein
MSERLQRFRNSVDDGYDGWRARVTLPYISAYTDAYDSFQKTKREQAEADRAQAELFVAAASIVTGSLLMATVGQASIRALAGNAALNVICRHNLDRVFNTFHAVSGSKAAMFAIGKVLDETKSQATRQIQGAVSELLSNTSNIVSAAPLVRYAQMDTFLLNHKLCAKRSAEIVEAAEDMNDAEKERAFAKLRQTPIANPPRTTIDQKRLSEKIELTFYMTAVLDTDTLVDWPAESGFGGMGSPMAGAMNARSRSIAQAPSAADYPREVPGENHWWGRSASRSIAYGDLGSQVEARLETLHRAVFGMPFGVGEGTRKQRKGAELRKAEETLDRLGELTRPRQISEVRA